MSTQQSLMPSAKSLCGIPKDLGPIEVIEFQTNHQTNDIQDPRPTDRTDVWYHSLEETEKQIKGLQLHETLGHPPFVVLSMNDNSFLLFELAPAASDPSSNLKTINVTRLTDSDVENLAPSSIQVNFLPAPEDGDAYVNLRFGIAICYGVLSCISQSSTKYGTQVWQRLFALAFFVSIVRQRLPIGESLVKNIHTITAVDQVCTEALSRSLVGQLLWEQDIVKEVHQAVRRGIHEAATGQLESSIFSTAVLHNLANKKYMVEKNIHIAKLVAARLETTADKVKSPAEAIWDAEWDKSWASDWEKYWLEHWSEEDLGLGLIPETILSLIRYLFSRDQFLPKFSAISVLSGSAAGRAMIEVPLVASIIPREKLPVIETLMPPQTEGPSNILVDREVELPLPAPPTSPVEGMNATTFPTTQPKDSDEPMPAQRVDKHSWFEFWYSVRRPDLKQQGRWLPVWEAARNLAWALAWEDYPEKDEQPPVPPSSARHGSQPRGTHPQPGGNADLLDLQELGRRFMGLFNRPQPEVSELDTNTMEPNFHKLTEAAWTEVLHSDPKMDQYMVDQGKEVFESLKKEMERTFPGVPVNQEWRDQCVNIFKNTLKKTWQKCWERAWEKVMNDTWKELEQCKSLAASYTKTPNISISAGSSKIYENLEGYMKNENSEEIHRCIRSAFKASNLLHRALEHSVPICYKHAMTIRYFPDRPFDFSTPNPGSKLKGITKAIHQDREQPMTHKELQERIKHLASVNRYRAPKFPDNFLPTQKMESIWETANSVDAKPEFMTNTDVKLAWPRRKVQTRKHPERKNTISLARIRARYLWQKTLKDLLGNKPSTSANPTQAEPAGTTASAAKNIQT
ncbi:hypothetical protein FRC11_000415 [Ceratobasidium sp. 423]|nr:hypothetical protein FRC11_000415 [Ceratobasidium sp. 423]